MGGSKIVKFKNFCSESETVVPSVCTFSKSNSTFDTHNLEKSDCTKKYVTRCQLLHETFPLPIYIYIYIYMKYMSINFKIHLHLPLDTEW